MRILVIEDDNLIGNGLYVGLKKLGFAVDWFKDGITGEEALFSAPYEAVILDLNLPGLNGLTILKDWRAAGRTEPVLILTAAGDLDDRITGLDSGADDYLAKPFALTEVVARIKALVRRNHQELRPEIVHGNLAFNQETKSITFKGTPITLSPKELLLLEILLLDLPPEKESTFK